ncbi:DUF1775 domain-containing protein [Streptomyces sp. NPDC013953]|uniref:DUF1775 domain-containing protein n=1 Tax=Streptomyces sp. NPDC013953 TaxID=3364868 RepID=UPI0036FF62D3
MSRTHITPRRLGTSLTTAVAAVLLGAGPAVAHVEVEADTAQALAENVTLTFDAESESDTAGITELRVVLPQGLTPADVTYGKGPKGWSFSRGADGYTVKGPAVAAGEGAEYSVIVRQLPRAGELAFKTLQIYSDGRIDRWIELGDSGSGSGHGHGNSAPVLKLAPAPGAATTNPTPTASAPSEPTPTAPTPTAPTPTAPTPAAPTPTSTATAAASDGDDGMSAGAWAGIAAAALVAVAAAYALRRRSGAR